MFHLARSTAPRPETASTASTAPCERDAARDDGRDGDRNDERPEEREPAEDSPERYEERRPAAGWQGELADEQQCGSDEEERQPEGEVSRRVEVECDDAGEGGHDTARQGEDEELVADTSHASHRVEPRRAAFRGREEDAFRDRRSGSRVAIPGLRKGPSGDGTEPATPGSNRGSTE